MTIFAVRHITTYSYRRKVRFGEHRLLFRPRDSYDQRLLTESLVTRPEPVSVRWVHDVFGNCVALVGFDTAASELKFETNITLEHTSDVPLDLIIDDEARHYPFSYDPLELPDIRPLMERHCPDPAGAVDHWARQFVKVGHPTDTGHLLMTMCYAIRESFIYRRRSSRGIQLPTETLELRSGTCRDFALLMMEGARALGLPARFVSGYIFVPDRDGSQTLGGGSTHAWCQIYLPGAGWVEFDPTNGIVGSRDLIRVAVARDPRQAIPLSGSYDGDAEDYLDMNVQVNVTSIGQSSPSLGTGQRPLQLAR
ncbi:MAG: transglutaminase family protein [Rhizobium sp.]|nr:transglutaminase family protein [Rhizobium sp.]